MGVAEKFSTVGPRAHPADPLRLPLGQVRPGASEERAEGTGIGAFIELVLCELLGKQPSRTVF